MADRVGFEPTVPLLVHLISSQGRYDRFDTCPYSLAVPLYPIAPEKSSRDTQFFPQIFSVRSYNPIINLYKSIDKVLMLRYDRIMKSEEKR